MIRFICLDFTTDKKKLFGIATADPVYAQIRERGTTERYTGSSTVKKLFRQFNSFETGYNLTDIQTRLGVTIVNRTRISASDSLVYKLSSISDMQSDLFYPVLASDGTVYYVEPTSTYGADRGSITDAMILSRTLLTPGAVHYDGENADVTVSIKARGVYPATAGSTYKTMAVNKYSSSLDVIRISARIDAAIPGDWMTYAGTRYVILECIASGSSYIYTLAAEINDTLSFTAADAVIQSIYIPYGYLDTDGALAANSDTRVASQKAVKTYVDTRTQFKYDYNHSSRPSSDQTLGVGESKKITISAAASTWYLDLAVSNYQVYELYVLNISDLSPNYLMFFANNNNLAQFQWFRGYRSHTGGFTSADSTQNGAVFGGDSLVFAKHTIYVAGQYYGCTFGEFLDSSSGTPRHFFEVCNRLITSISWTSLGQLYCTSNETGIVVIKRIA